MRLGAIKAQYLMAHLDMWGPEDQVVVADRTASIMASRSSWGPLTSWGESLVAAVLPTREHVGCDPAGAGR